MPRYRPSIARPLPVRAQGSPVAQMLTEEIRRLEREWGHRYEFLYVRAYGGGIPEFIILDKWQGNRAYHVTDLY